MSCSGVKTGAISKKGLKINLFSFYNFMRSFLQAIAAIVLGYRKDYVNYSSQ